MGHVVLVLGLSLRRIQLGIETHDVLPGGPLQRRRHLATRELAERARGLPGQPFVGKVPVNFAVATRGRAGSPRADAVLIADDAKRGERFVLKRKTTCDVVWHAADRRVPFGDVTGRLVVAISESTADVKYLITKALDTPLATLLAVAYHRTTSSTASGSASRRWVCCTFNCRPFSALERHLILALIVLGFVAVHTERLPGENPEVAREQVCRALYVQCELLLGRRCRHPPTLLSGPCDPQPSAA